MKERQQYIKRIVSVYDQHGNIKNKEAINLLCKKWPEYNTAMWGNDFRSAKDTAKRMGLLPNNGIKHTVAEHERASPGKWGIK